MTSNPSPQYVERIARRFNDDGAGRRGNLGAVIRAILLDQEARDASTAAAAGKLKEPLLRLTQLWRAYGVSSASGSISIRGSNLSFGQGPLQAPSVFNFYSPSYAPPGEIANQNLVAPELQIATEYLNTNVTNYLLRDRILLRADAGDRLSGGEEHAGDRHIDGELVSERSGRARGQDRRSPVCRPDLFRPAR